MASSIIKAVPSTGRDSLAQRLDVAKPVILANNWATAHQVEHATAQALASGADGAGLGRFLVDQRVISREQAHELDDIIKNQELFSDYRLLRKLGAGGMGTVFLAEHLESGRQVAMKTMNARLATDKDFVGRFHREAKALASVKHPNIAEILGSGEHDGNCWLAMEFIDGPSLMHMLRDYRALPEGYALRIAKQVAEGLGHVWNQAHLVHRDIKPENILVVRNRNGGGDLFPADDHAMLIDFGLVKSQESDDRLTQTGMTIGTPLYMSPEQVRGEKLDCRSDIYGLGATLYHLLTGATPFTGTSPGSIMSAHLTEPVPDAGVRVPGLHQATRELVKMAMAKEADRRFLTFDALCQALDSAIQQVAGKGGGTLRLLRKPLILNKPTRKQPEAKAPTPPAEPAAKPISDRVAKTGSDALAQVATESIRKPPTGRTAAPGSDRIAATERGGTAPSPGSDRIANGPGTAPITKPPSTAVQGKSKVFDEDPQAQLKMGLLPWLVLGGAVAALAAWLLLR